MAVIKNKLNQRIVIDICGKSINVFSNDTAEVEDKDLSDPTFRGFLDRGDVVLMEGKVKKSSDKKSGSDGKKK